MTTLQSDSVTSDITFVGFGPANTGAFLDFIEQTKLLASIGEKIPPLRITIIDADGNHGAGKPYGPQASEFQLFNNELKFVGDGFPEWIKRNKRFWLPVLEAHKDTNLKEWFAVNAQNIREDKFDDMFFPRFLYGIFKRQQIMQALHEAPPELKIHFLQGKAVDIDKNNDGTDKLIFDKYGARSIEIKPTDDSRRYAVVPTTDTQIYHSIDSACSVLGIGTPEPKDLLPGNHTCYFNSSNTDNPDVPGAFPVEFKAKVREHFERNRGKKVKLCVLGTAASFLDMVNMIAADPELKEKIDMHAISSTGFVKSRPEETRMSSYKPIILTPDYQYTTPEQFIKDVFAEIDHGMNKCREKYSTQDIMWGTCAQKVFKKYEQELQRFKEVHYIAEFMARTTEETRRSLDYLDIKFIPGRVQDLAENPDGTICVNFAKTFLKTGIPYNRSMAEFPSGSAFDIVVNCMGFDKTTSVPIIKHGIEKGIFHAHQDSGKLVVGENLSISPTIILNGFMALDYGHSDPHMPFVNQIITPAGITATAICNKALNSELKGALSNSTLTAPPVNIDASHREMRA